MNRFDVRSPGFEVQRRLIQFRRWIEPVTSELLRPSLRLVMIQPLLDRFDNDPVSRQLRPFDRRSQSLNSLATKVNTEIHPGIMT